MSNLVTYDISHRRPNPSFLAKAFGAIEQLRSYWQGPVSLRDRELARLFGAGYQTDAGVVVTPEKAFTFSAVYDAVNQIASDVAKLPLQLRKRLPNGGSEEYVDSKVYRLLKDEPNPEMSSMVFRRTLMAHALTLKGGFAEIERDGTGRPAALWPITPDRVEPFRRELRRPDGAVTYGPLQYKVDNRVVIDGRDMIHIHGLGYDGYIGYAVLSLARQAIGLALASEQFGASFFANGSGFGGILMNDALGAFDDEEREKNLRRTISEYQRSSNKLRQFLLLFGPGKWDFKQTGINPRDSQMDELRDTQVEEVARFFNIPIHKLKVSKPGAVSYASVEMSDLEYFKGCLLNWITLWEQELNRKLIAPLESRQQFIKHNANAFLRGDIKSRYEALGIARDKGIICADDWRELEDMNPQPNGQGKVFLVQQAMVPADKVVALVDSQIKKNETPKPAPATPASSTPSAPDAERMKELERLAEEARSEAQQEREARIAIEATGQATVAELDAAKLREQDANTRAVEFGRLAEQLRANLADIQTNYAAASAALADATQGRTVAEQALVAASEAAERATADLSAKLAAESEELSMTSGLLQEAIAERDAAATRATEAEARAENAMRTLTDVEARAERHAAEAAQSADLAVKTDLAAREAESRAADAVTDRAKALADAETARRLADEARATAAAADVARQDSERRLAEQAQQVADLLLKVDAANTRLDELGQAVVAAEAQRDAALAEAQAAVACQAEAVRLATEAEQRATVAAEQAEVVIGNERAARHDEQRKASDADEARLAAEAREQEIRQAEADAAAATVAAHRALVVHVMRKAIERETDRARRAQGSTEKFRAWMDKWYDNHEALMVAELLPVVQVHLAFIRSTDDAGDTARALAHAHVSTSRQQLESVLDGDAGAFAASLAQLLTRWDTERTDTIANALFEKEIDYVRRRG